jgi:hypothetical protein
MGELEKLAIITEGLQQVVPDSNPIVFFELNKDRFLIINRKLNPNGSDSDTKFKINISGVSFYFVLEEIML